MTCKDLKVKKLKTLMRLLFVVCLLTVYSLQLTTNNLFAEESKFHSSGPLNIRNQMPLYLFYMAPTPDKAETLGKGKIKTDTSYHVSNVIVQQRPSYAQYFGPSLKDREWWVYVDTEVNRLDLNFSYGIMDNLEFSVDIPYFIFSDGYLDGFIEGFEDAFSGIKTPNAREEKERYDYEYEIRNRGNVIINSTSKPNAFGEVSAYLKYKILDESDWKPTLSLRGAVKLPTAGDELLGSDEFDYAIGLLLDKTFSKRLSVYLNINYIFLGEPDIMSELVDFRDEMVHGVIGVEYIITDKTSMLIQATANTTVYDYDGLTANGGVTSTGRDPVVLTLGFNHNFNDKVSWQIAVDENTNTAAPDFGVFTSFKIKL